MANFGEDLLRSPDVEDENGQVLFPHARWRVVSGLRARVVGSVIELHGDAPGQGLKAQVRAATTANIDLASPGGTIGLVALNAGDRVLVKDQSVGAQNGIYVFDTASTPMARATDYDETAEVRAGSIVAVREGTHQATVWMLTTVEPLTLGTTALTYTKISGGVLSAPADPADDGKIATGSGGDLVYVSDLAVPGELTVGGQIAFGSATDDQRGITYGARQTSIANGSTVTLWSIDPTVLLGATGQVTVALLFHIRSSALGRRAFGKRAHEYEVESSTLAEVGTFTKPATDKGALVDETDYFVTLDDIGGAIRARVQNASGQPFDCSMAIVISGTDW